MSQAHMLLYMSRKIKNTKKVKTDFITMNMDMFPNCMLKFAIKDMYDGLCKVNT
jgi:hypothetical protein